MNWINVFPFSANFDAPTIFFKYSILYFDLTVLSALVVIFVSSPSFTTILALERSPSEDTVNVPLSTIKLTESPTTSTSSIAPFKTSDAVSILTEKPNSGIF